MRNRRIGLIKINMGSGMADILYKFKTFLNIKVNTRFRKIFSLLIPPFIVIILLQILAYTWCISVDQPLDKLLSLNIKYYPVIFVYLKIGIQNIGYIWSFTLFIGTYYSIFNKIIKTSIIHTILISFIITIVIVPLYLIVMNYISLDKLFIQYYLLATMIILEAYIAFAIIHLLYYSFRILLGDVINSRIKIILLVLLLHLMGFVLSAIIGVITLISPNLFIQPAMNCRAPLFELNKWMIYIVPSFLSLIDSYVSLIVRFIVMIFIVERLKYRS